MPAPVPGSPNTGSDQDMHVTIDYADTGAPGRFEEAGHVHEKLELPGTRAVLQIILLPAGQTAGDSHAPRPPAPGHAATMLGAVVRVAALALLGALSPAVPI